MASDPESPDDLWARAGWRSGIFARCYTLRLYYVGYGGNHNRTTRFRRYDGNTLTVDASTPQQVAVLSYIG